MYLGRGTASGWHRLHPPYGQFLYARWPLLKANFYEKALFVKVDLATALWWKQLLSALRAMLLFAVNTL